MPEPNEQVTPQAVEGDEVDEPETDGQESVEGDEGTEEGQEKQETEEERVAREEQELFAKKGWKSKADAAKSYENVEKKVFEQAEQLKETRRMLELALKKEQKQEGLTPQQIEASNEKFKDDFEKDPWGTMSAVVNQLAGKVTGSQIKKLEEKIAGMEKLLFKKSVIDDNPGIKEKMDLINEEIASNPDLYSKMSPKDIYDVAYAKVLKKEVLMEQGKKKNLPPNIKQKGTTPPTEPNLDNMTADEMIKAGLIKKADLRGPSL